MAYITNKLTAMEIATITPRVHGPIFSISPTCAVDGAKGAMFVSLGGQPWRDPADQEPPGHFNLFWRGQVVGASGFCTTTQGEEEDTVTFRLSVSVPNTLAAQTDEVMQLIQDGLIAFWKSLSPFRFSLHVEIIEVVYF